MTDTLEIGGGETPKFHPNMDIRKVEGVDIVGRVEDGIPLPDDSVQHVYSSYTLEHIGWRDLNKALKEILRVLKPGGNVFFVVPNTFAQCQEVVKRGVFGSNEACMLFGDQNYGENSHRTGFSAQGLAELMKELGYLNIIIQSHADCPTDMIVNAMKKPKLISPPENDVFERAYFEDGTYGYTMYRDFGIHYKTHRIIENTYNPQSVLEIGAGRGYIVKLFERDGINATAMDISKHCWYTRATDSFILHDMTKVPWPVKDKEYDVCFSIAVMEHISEKDLPNVIKEMSRVCKRSIHGVTFTHADNDIDTTHKTFKSKEEWEKVFKDNAPEMETIILDKQALESYPMEVPGADNLVKLNVGCFQNMYYYGWRNSDILDMSTWAKMNGYEFQRWDAGGHWPYEYDSVDIVLLSHVLEHFTSYDGLEVLKEAFRVLKPGGILRIAVPDLEKVKKAMDDGTIMDFKYFNTGVEKAKTPQEAFDAIMKEGHKAQYTKETLGAALHTAGFDTVALSYFGQSKSPNIEKETIDQYPEISVYLEVQKPTGITVGVPLTSKVKTGDKLNIALVSTPFIDTPPKAYGGLERIVADIGKRLAKHGHTITIFATDDSEVEGCKIVKCGKALGTANTDWYKAELAMYEIYKDQLKGFDIIHGSNWFGFEYRAKALNPSLKVCHTHHGGMDPNWWARYKPPFSLNIVSISDWMAEAYRGIGINARRVYNGVDLERYPLSMGMRTKEFAFVGRLDMNKRPDIAIDISRQMQVPLNIIGGTFVTDDNYVKSIKQKVEESKGMIRLFTDATHDKKVEVLRNSMCCLFTSAMGEPFGLVPIESMACGTPVMAVNDGAVPEVVKSGGAIAEIFKKDFVNGRVSYHVLGDSNAIGKKLEEAVRKAIMIPPKVCRKNAEEFTVEAMAVNYEAVYSDIINGKEW